jgi:hypothetical protein
MKKTVAANGAANRPAKTKLVYELRKACKRQSAIFIDKAGNLSIQDGDGNRPVSLPGACLKYAQMMKEYAANEKTEIQGGNISEEAQWAQMIADVMAMVDLTLPNKYEKIVRITTATANRVDDYCNQSGYIEAEVVEMGLQHVLDRVKAGQEPDRKEPAEGGGRDLIFVFDTQFPIEYNGLVLCDGDLYAVDMLNHTEVFEAGERFPLATAPARFLHPISVKEALAWYARCNPWSTDSTGSMQTVCAMAAKAL